MLTFGDTIHPDSLPTYYSDTGLTTNLVLDASVDRLQVRIVPTKNDSTKFAVCLAYGTTLNVVYVSKYEYSTLNKSFTFVYNVSLGGVTVFQGWSFPDRGSEDCTSIALITEVSKMEVRCHIAFSNLDYLAK